MFWVTVNDKQKLHLDLELTINDQRKLLLWLTVLTYAYMYDTVHCTNVFSDSDTSDICTYVNKSQNYTVASALSVRGSVLCGDSEYFWDSVRIYINNCTVHVLMVHSFCLNP